MAEDKIRNNEPLTKEEKAKEAGKDIAKVAAQGVAMYYGGPTASKLVDMATKTKQGQQLLDMAGTIASKNWATRNLLAKNHGMINMAKPIANSMLGGTNEAKNSSGKENNIQSQDINNAENEDNNEQYYSSQTYDNDTSSQGSGIVKAIWKKIPIKVKLIILGIIVVFCLLVTFIVVLLSPLMELGIIDIEDIVQINVGSNQSIFSSVSGSIKYWWPVDSTKSSISSPYGYRNDPQNGTKTMHNGIDIITGDGPGVVNIIAADNGTVTTVNTGCPTTISLNDENTSDEECGGKYGNYIIITHPDQKVTVYAHLYSVSVSNGAEVSKGQVIGTMGSSGKSTGTHLHFEVRVNGGRVNPTDHVSITVRKP